MKERTGGQSQAELNTNTQAHRELAHSHHTVGQVGCNFAYQKYNLGSSISLKHINQLISGQRTEGKY